MTNDIICRILHEFSYETIKVHCTCMYFLIKLEEYKRYTIIAFLNAVAYIQLLLGQTTILTVIAFHTHPL